MIKKTVFAVMGLAFALALASPPKAHAGVVIGVGVGPAFVPRPAYGYGYVGVYPRPYAYPYGYAPVYERPHYIYPAYGYYGHVYRGGYWAHPDCARVSRLWMARWLPALID